MDIKGLINAASTTIFGTALFKPSANSTTALQVQDKDGNVAMVVDTTNRRVGVKGGSPPIVTLDLRDTDNTYCLVCQGAAGTNFVAFGTRTGITNGTPSINGFTAASAGTDLCLQVEGGNLGVGTATPKSKLHVTGLPVFANNAAAITGGLTAGAFYRTGGDPDPVCVVH